MSEGNALEKSHHVAAKKMAEFWASLLRADTVETLIKGWVGEGDRQGDFDDFGVEFMQASVAVQTSPDYTDEEAAAFNKALEARILEAFIEPEFSGHLFFNIKNDYYPDDLLIQAGLDAGIDIGMIAFPFKTSTTFDIWSEKLMIQQGGATHRIRLNPDRPVKHAYFVYQTEPDGPLKTLELDEDDLVRERLDDIDRIISEKEGRRTFTIHFIGPFFTTTPEEAISACGYVGGYEYKFPQDVANDWVLRAETEESVDFFVKKRGADVSKCLEILEERERNAACLSPISPINSLKTRLNSLIPRI